MGEGVGLTNFLKKLYIKNKNIKNKLDRVVIYIRI